MTTAIPPSLNATLRIQRLKNKIFSKKTASILVNNHLHSFHPEEVKEFEVEPGSITITLNEKKRLTFNISTGERKNFVIRESIDDWRFYLKYGILFLLLVFFLIILFFEIFNSKNPLSEITGTIYALWAFSEIRNEFFYLEEI